MTNAFSIFVIFLRLGLTSFGGPVAHLGYFRDEFVKRRQWLTEHAYADLIGLCQFLPGPSSSQIGMAIGLGRGGYLGAVAAWLGFTLPSAVLMILIGMWLAKSGSFINPYWQITIKVVAIVVVSKALWGMSKALCPDMTRRLMALAAAVVVVMVPSAWSQLAVIAGGGILGLYLFKDGATAPHAQASGIVSRAVGAMALVVFALLLVGLPFVTTMDDATLQFSKFFRAGSMVFGGGHVVLPLLQAEVVPRGWVSSDTFLAGYGAAQAMPGPLFTFAAFLGAASSIHPSGWTGGLLCLVAIFLPSFLLVIGVMPFWESMRKHAWMQCAVRGINAAVVGLLLAALAGIIGSFFPYH